MISAEYFSVIVTWIIRSYTLFDGGLCFCAQHLRWPEDNILQATEQLGYLESLIIVSRRKTTTENEEFGI